MIESITATDIEWRHIPGYEGLYMANNYGEIMRLPREQSNDLTGGVSVFPSKILKPKVSKSGYLHIQLTKDGKPKTFLVHRIIAMTFLEQENGDELQVNHIDGDKTNNQITNLEFTTAKENTRHAFLIGLRTRKVDEQQVGDIISRYLNGESQKSIARAYGLYYTTVYRYIKMYKKGDLWLAK